MHVLNIKQNIYILSVLDTEYFLKIGKINYQQEKPIGLIEKNLKLFPQNTTNSQSVEAYLDSWLDWLAVFQTFDS